MDDAVKAAGGLSEDADESVLNLALPLTDGTRYDVGFVESAEEAASIPSESAAAETVDSSDKLININTASKTLLITLPGIGEG